MCLGAMFRAGPFDPGESFGLRGERAGEDGQTVVMDDVNAGGGHAVCRRIECEQFHRAVPTRVSRAVATPQLWLNLQQAYDLSAAVAQHGAHINDVVHPKAA